MFSKHPYQVVGNAIIVLCGVLLAINTKELLITISFVCGAAAVYFGAKLVVSFVLAPIFFFLRMKKHGEVRMVYSEAGIELQSDKESGFKEWEHYSRIQIDESSFQLIRRDNVHTYKISRSVFKDFGQFQQFHRFVEERLRIAEAHLKEKEKEDQRVGERQQS